MKMPLYLRECFKHAKSINEKAKLIPRVKGEYLPQKYDFKFQNYM